MEYGSRPAGQARSHPPPPTTTSRTADHTRDWQRRRRADTIEQARYSGGRYPEEARVPRIERENPEARYQVPTVFGPFGERRLTLCHPPPPVPGFPFLGPGYPHPPVLFPNSRLPGWPFSSLQEIQAAQIVVVKKYIDYVSEIGFPSVESRESTFQEYHRLEESHERARAEALIDEQGNFVIPEHLLADPEQKRHSKEQSNPVQQQTTHLEEGSLVPPLPEGFDYPDFFTKASSRAASTSVSASKKKRSSLLDKIKPIFKRRSDEIPKTEAENASPDKETPIDIQAGSKTSSYLPAGRKTWSSLQEESKSSSYPPADSKTSSYFQRDGNTSSHFQGDSNTSSYLQGSTNTSGYLQESGQTSNYLQRDNKTSSYPPAGSKTSSYFQSDSRTSSNFQPDSKTSRYAHGDTKTLGFLQRDPTTSSNFQGSSKPLSYLQQESKNSGEFLVAPYDQEQGEVSLSCLSESDYDGEEDRRQSLEKPQNLRQPREFDSYHAYLCAGIEHPLQGKTPSDEFENSRYLPTNQGHQSPEYRPTHKRHVAISSIPGVSAQVNYQSPKHRSFEASESRQDLEKSYKSNLRHSDDVFAPTGVSSDPYGIRPGGSISASVKRAGGTWNTQDLRSDWAETPSAQLTKGHKESKPEKSIALKQTTFERWKEDPPELKSAVPSHRHPSAKILNLLNKFEPGKEQPAVPLRRKETSRDLRVESQQHWITDVNPVPPTATWPAPPRPFTQPSSPRPQRLIRGPQDQDFDLEIESPTRRPRARLPHGINQREVDFSQSNRRTTAASQDSTYQQAYASYPANSPLTSYNLHQNEIDSEARLNWWAGPNLAQGATHRAENEARTPPARRVTLSEHISHYNNSPDLFPELLPAPLSIQKSEDQSPTNSQTPPPQPSFLDSCLSVEIHPAKMDLLQVRSAERSSTKVKAVEDARQMQASIIEEAKKSGKDPPKYVLMELIGKGSFGRVYKGKDMISAAIVAVKIIDIDESDTLNPRLADTYSEFMKEVNALKILSISKARNINHVIEALPVGKAMWMITEYCGGGSIATLMKPTPGGLKERWIIPILREVAEAVKWVHQAGIIHRDLKCANVLITEEGGVQLCDFGVAGITESTVDKRSTFIGTMNWMAPELFDAVPEYGKEVDIWAFGSMAYEMATGLPPNAMSGMTEPQDMGPYLKQHIPRLEGSKYSESLRDIVAYCLEEKVSDRPSIEAVQKHAYICNTQTKYPASSLSELVKAFKKWEDSGGTRKSLFMRGGAQGPSDSGPSGLGDDDWNFSTTAAFDQAVAQGTNVEDVINVYGSSVDMATEFADETSRPSRQQVARERGSRRRPPPEALAPLKAPLEKLFDPNTMSNYEDNARTHYGREFSMPASDLPLRDDSAQNSIRDTMIDLGGHDVQTGISNFPDVDTLRPGKRTNIDEEDDYATSLNDFTRLPLSDPADNLNRRTQDWKFPSMAPPASADPELSMFSMSYEGYEMPSRPKVTPGSGARPPLVHHPTEPVSVPTQGFGNLVASAPSSPSRLSLIDLDLSVPEPSRPSTADSTNSNGAISSNPFEFEKHASAIYQHSAREPSLYLNEDSVFNSQVHSGSAFNDLLDVSDFSTSDAEGNYGPSNGHGIRALNQSFDETSLADHEYSQAMPPPPLPSDHARGRNNRGYDMSHFPVLPSPPSVAAMSGTASQAEMMSEMHRMIGGFTAQLSSFKDVYEALPTGREKKDKEKSDRED